VSEQSKKSRSSQPDGEGPEITGERSKRDSAVVASKSQEIINLSDSGDSGQVEIRISDSSASGSDLLDPIQPDSIQPDTDQAHDEETLAIGSLAELPTSLGSATMPSPIADTDMPPASVDALRATASAESMEHRETLPGAPPADPISEEQTSSAGTPTFSQRARNAVSAFSQTLDANSESYSGSSDAQPSHSSSDDDHIADPLLGMVVADRYCIRELLGRGGMGIVYQVEHTSLGKLLAMKLLTGELSTNKEVVRRFKQEALVVSKLSNPHTVQVFDYGQWNHLTYLVMELVEGHDMSRPLRKEGPMPFARLGKLMVQVCGSLIEAHEKGITHRDIKPENIMIIKDPRGHEMAKVLDFGLAKLRENKELNEVTLQGAVIGTPYYMSPEQVLGEDVDGRTDIYALGALMFRAVTGEQAFEAGTPMGMFTKHLTAPAPSACERAPHLDIPEGVGDIILCCMAKEAKERFQTVDELRDALIVELDLLGMSNSDRRSLNDAPSSDGRDSLTGGPAKKKKKKKHKFSRTQNVATRKELESYERKLRRNRYGYWGVLGVLLAGGIGATLHFGLKASRGELGLREHEPNNLAAEANALRFGQAITGHVGRRSQDGAGDRDFYAFEVTEDADALVSIQLSSLPNFAICAMLYRTDIQQPLAQYCTGRPGQDLVVSNLRVTPGEYLVAVLQDPNPEGSERTPFVLENVSDAYHLEVAKTSSNAEAELEPNDTRSSAQRMLPGTELEATLAWVDDRDIICVDDAHEGAVRWHVSDEARPAGTVLEVTPMTGESPGPLARIHVDGSRPFGRPKLEADVNNPWASPVVPTSDNARCIQLELVSDPWIVGGAGPPQPNTANYTVKLLAAASSG
jgi:serine/threonine protein kinase